MQVATLNPVLTIPTEEEVWALPNTTDQSFDLPTDEDSHAPCGTWHVSGNLLTGKPIRYQQFCEHWRNSECPICFGRRVSRFRSRIAKAYFDLGEEDFSVVILSRDDAADLARRCSQNDSLYYRCPTSLYDYVIFQPFLNSPESDLHWRDLDWETLSNTPKGRRPSGKLGAKEKEDAAAVMFKAEILTIEYDAPALIVLEAWKKAIEQTKDANPTNPEQAETAMNERLNYVAFNISQLGGKVLRTYYRNVNVPENSVLSWSYKDTIKELSGHEEEELAIPDVWDDEFPAPEIEEVDGIPF